MPPLMDIHENESRSMTPLSETSDYGSMENSTVLPEVIFTPRHLKFLNKRLSQLEPEEILRWCLISLPDLYQTTALGLTGSHISLQNSDCQVW
jgi:phosphoadenosine phosphosulfate reductase